MKNYFILHGTFGNNQENWFPWLEKQIVDCGGGRKCYNLNYPTPTNMNFESWSKILNQYKQSIDENTCFVCHSSSCVFVVKYCVENDIKIGKAIFVSGFNNYYFLDDFDKLNKDFYLVNAELFRNLCKERICIYSKNDPYVKFNALEKFADEIDAKKVVFENAGHFNADAGFLKFEDILKFL